MVCMPRCRNYFLPSNGNEDYNISSVISKEREKLLFLSHSFLSHRRVWAEGKWRHRTAEILHFESKYVHVYINLLPFIYTDI